VGFFQYSLACALCSLGFCCVFFLLGLGFRSFPLFFIFCRFFFCASCFSPALTPGSFVIFGFFFFFFGFLCFYDLVCFLARFFCFFILLCLFTQSRGGVGGAGAAQWRRGASFFFCWWGAFAVLFRSFIDWRGGGCVGGGCGVAGGWGRGARAPGPPRGPKCFVSWHASSAEWGIGGESGGSGGGAVGGALLWWRGTMVVAGGQQHAEPA